MKKYKEIAIKRDRCIIYTEDKKWHLMQELQVSPPLVEKEKKNIK